MAAPQGNVLYNSILRIFSILRLEKKEIYAIYWYAIIAGLLQLTLPLGIQSIINFVLAGTFSTSMVVLITGVVFGVFLTGVLQVLQMKLNEKIQQSLFVQYSFEYAYRLPKIEMSSIDGYYMPELTNRFFDIVSLQKSLGKILLEIPTATIQIIFGLLLLSFYNAAFIFFGLLLVIVLVLILRFSSRVGLRTSLEESDYKYKVAAWLQETARVMKSLKFAGKNAFHIKKTDENVSGYLKARTAHFKVLLFQYWTLIVFKTVITLAMLVVGGLLLVDQQLNVGQFVAAEIVILLVLGSVEKFILNLDKVYDVLTSVTKLGKILDKPLEQGGKLLLNGTAGPGIQVEHLSFSYDDEKIIDNFSMTIPGGSVVSITGPPRSGKSTLLKVLTGAYDNFEGRILINNIPIGNYDLNSLRSQMGIFLNQQEIFEGSLWDNIATGECDFTMEQLMHLAKKVGLADFISDLRDGFDTELQPLGQKLARSTAQRILFLRAIAARPKLLLLEEPWGSLDETTAAAMLDIIRTELRGSTVIVTSTQEFMKDKADLHITLRNHS